VISGSDVTVRKSEELEIESEHRYGEIENRNEVADFLAILLCNRSSIEYFGLKPNQFMK